MTVTYSSGFPHMCSPVRARLSLAAALLIGALPACAALDCDEPSPVSAPVLEADASLAEGALAAFDRWLEAWPNAAAKHSPR